MRCLAFFDVFICGSLNVHMNSIQHKRNICSSYSVIKLLLSPVTWKMIIAVMKIRERERYQRVAWRLKEVSFKYIIIHQKTARYLGRDGNYRSFCLYTVSTILGRSCMYLFWQWIKPYSWNTRHKSLRCFTYPFDLKIIQFTGLNYSV